MTSEHRGAGGLRAVVVAGEAGSGKTTLGRALARRLGAAVLDLDPLTEPLLDGLRDLLGGPHWLTGPHAGTVRAARYAALRETARDVLGAGSSVVLVAPFTAELRGGPEWELLRAALAPAVPEVIHLQGSPEVLARRRAARGQLRDGFREQVVAPPPRVPHTAVDVLLDPRQQEARAALALGALTPPDPAHPVFGRPYDAVLLDLDGTLVDSTPAVLRAWARLGEEFGIPGDAVQRNHGRPAEGLLARFLAPAEAARALTRVEELETADVDGVVALPGAKELLGRLPTGRWAVVTSGTTPVAGARLAAAGLVRPSVFVTRDRVRHPKPHPEPFLLAATELGVDPSRCLVLEDAPAGIASAVAAGCTAIGIAGTVGAGELGAADLVVESLEQVRFESSARAVRVFPA